MAKAKSQEQARNRSRAAAVEEINRGMGKLRGLVAQVEDLSRDGFPYQEAVRARSELGLRESIRQIFGEKSKEYQTHKNHRLRVNNRAESEQTLVVLKELLASLEAQKLELLGQKPPANPPAEPPPQPIAARMPEPVAPAPPPTQAGPAHVTITPLVAPASHAAPQPFTMSVAFTTNMGIPSATTPLPRSVPSVEPTASSAPPAPAKAQNRPVHATMEQISVESREPSDRGHSVAPLATQTECSQPNGEVQPAPTPGPTASGVQAGASDREAIRHVTAPAADHSSGTKAQEIREQALPSPSLPRAVTRGERTTIRAAAPPAGQEVAVHTAQRPPEDTVRLSMDQTVLDRDIPPQSPLPDQTPTPPTTCEVTPSSPPGSPETCLDLVRKICTRFHMIARQLRLRREYRPTIEIEDERDVHDLLYALLRLEFEEIEASEWSPDYALGTTSTTYLIPKDKIIIAAKKTRAGLSAREIAQQVKTDADHYLAQDHCRTFFCFVYDPEGRIGNPRGLETDLAMVTDSCSVDVLVAPK